MFLGKWPRSPSILPSGISVEGEAGSFSSGGSSAHAGVCERAVVRGEWVPHLGLVWGDTRVQLPQTEKLPSGELGFLITWARSVHAENVLI